MAVASIATEHDAFIGIGDEPLGEQTIEVPDYDAWRGSMNTPQAMVTMNNSNCAPALNVIINLNISAPFNALAPTKNGAAAKLEAYVDAELAKIKTLEPGWAGDGTEAISPEVAALAKSFILSLFRETGVRNPYVLPAAEGGIQFEWHDGARSLEFEVLPDKNVIFCLFDPETSTEPVAGSIPVSTIWMACGLVREFLRQD